MKLRKEQTDVLRQQALVDFEGRALRHLRRDLAEQTSSYGDDELRRRVREGMSRAAKYGLKTEQQVMCFVDASFLLGEHFDTDPAHGWSVAVLGSDKLAASDRANLLLATACSVVQGKE